MSSTVEYLSALIKDGKLRMEEKKRLCVCTIAHGEKYENLALTTHPIFLAYANRIGADFKVGRKPDIAYSPAWIKLILLYKLLKDYDRVIFLDTDITLHPECQSLFDIVPETHFGAYQEGEFLDRTSAMLRAIEFHKIKCNREYQNEYFNSGVMIISKCHRDLFIMPDQIEDNFYEQSLLNARVFAYNVPFHKLHYHFNRMFSHDEITGEDVFAAKIVHFAGAQPEVDVAGTIALIQEKWRNKEKPYTRIHISCGGGIGDVVMSEPIVRYALEVTWPESEFPDYRFTLSTAPHCQRVFEHLKHWKRLTIIDSLEKLEKVPYLTLETHPSSGRSIIPTIYYSECHNQDWASLASVRRYLTTEQKRIKLMVKPEDEDELLKAVSDFQTLHQTFHPPEPIGIDPLKSIAVHCGIGWPSKTFGEKYWQEVVDGLSTDGFQVILFGRRVSELFDIQTGKATAVHKGVEEGVKCPENGIDLRDKLSLGGLFALTNKCKATLSNDSVCSHICGAFDNWYFLIASCKHPDLVMPFRQGRQDWKARAFFKRLCNDVLKPNYPHGTSIANCKGDILDAIPPAKEVVDGIFKALNNLDERGYPIEEPHWPNED